MDIKIRQLHEADCTPTLLTNFNRYQEVRRCWRRTDGEWALVDISYVEQWNDGKKQSLTASLLAHLREGGRAVGAFDADTLVGFAWVLAEPFGSRRQYVNLDMMHTSYEYRGAGIGRRVFAAICEQARELGAEKLYISAHSAEETMAFYRKIGCVDAAEINESLAAAEPFDYQLEYIL